MTLSVEDRLDITDVLDRYATGIDRRDWDLFRTVLTPDCVVDYGEIGTWPGVEEVTAFMDAAHGVRAVGFYDDELVRTGGGWGVARRSFTCVLMQAEEGIAR